MERPGLTALPVEVIHHISRYLSVQDVLSCSLTCQYLRAALNDNYVWRKYLPQDISGLETRDQQVAPRFEVGESLTMLCEQRQQFARKTHLMNNWLEGNYVRYSNRSEYKFNMEMFINNQFGNEPGEINPIYKDKYIFLSRLVRRYNETGGIEIWDITKDPIFHTFIKIDKRIGCNRNERYCVVGSHLIITSCDTVSVYQINLPDKDLPLLYSFLITDNNVTFNEIVHHDSPSNNCYTDHYVVNNYLMLTQPESNRLHVWDINNASKIGFFEPPIYAITITLRSFFGNICMFELMTDAKTPNSLVTFNLDNKQFSNNKLTYDVDDYVKSVLCYDCHVIVIKMSKRRRPNHNHSSCGYVGLYDIICSLYDCDTFLELNQIRLTNTTDDKFFPSQCFVDGTFIITCRGRVHVVNALTLEIVNTVNPHSINYIVNYFNVYQKIIVAAENPIAMGGAVKKRKVVYNSTIQLWHVSRKDTLVIDVNVGLTILRGAYELFIDSLCTKLILIKGRNITVIHLW